MHAAVTDGVDRAAFHLPAASVVERERVALGLRLLDDQHREPTVTLRTVGIGAREQHQHVGAPGKRRPRLHAVDRPAAVGRGRRDLHAGDVGPVVGLGDHDADHQLTARDARQPGLLLRFGAARDERAREDLGPGDERTADAERSARQLFGRDDHPDVVGLAAGREPVVLLGYREAEAADLGEAADDVLGDVAVRSVDVLGDGPDLVVGEAAEGLGHELEVVGEMRRTGSVLDALVGERLEERRVAVRGDELVGRRQRRGIDAPRSRRARRAGSRCRRTRRRYRRGRASTRCRPARRTGTSPGTLRLPPPRGRGRRRAPDARRAWPPTACRRRSRARRGAGLRSSTTVPMSSTASAAARS